MKVDLANIFIADGLSLSEARQNREKVTTLTDENDRLRRVIAGLVRKGQVTGVDFFAEVHPTKH